MKGTLHGGPHDGLVVEVHTDEPNYEDWIRVTMLPPVTPIEVDENGDGIYGFDRSAVEIYMRDGESLDYYYDKSEIW